MPCPPYVVSPTAALSAGGEATQSRAGQPLPPPRGNTGPDAPQSKVGPLSCQGMPLDHIQLADSHILSMGLPSLSSPSLFIYPGLSHPTNTIWHLLNFTCLVIAQPSNFQDLFSIPAELVLAKLLKDSQT